MNTSTTEPTLAQRQAAGLRLLADMIEQNPQLAGNLDHSLSFAGINVHSRTDDKATEMADFARLARRYGATTDKAVTNEMYNLVADFGGVSLRFLAYRSEVCERVVTGTREVTEQVPDPTALAAVPITTVTRVEDITEWKCRPLLADA